MGAPTLASTAVWKSFAACGWPGLCINSSASFAVCGWPGLCINSSASVVLRRPAGHALRARFAACGWPGLHLNSSAALLARLDWIMIPKPASCNAWVSAVRWFSFSTMVKTRRFDRAIIKDSGCGTNVETRRVLPLEPKWLRMYKYIYIYMNIYIYVYTHRYIYIYVCN